MSFFLFFFSFIVFVLVLVCVVLLSWKIGKGWVGRLEG